jgi:PKD repeat protein
LTLSTRHHALICGIAFLIMGLLPFRSVERECVNILPVAKFTYLPSDPRVCDSVTFNASESYDPDGFIYSYTWDFGDGNTTTISIPTVVHNFHAQGEYDVNLTVRDNYLKTNSTVEKVHVRSCVVSDPPTATFVWTPPEPKAGEHVLFDASKSTPNGGELVSYIWDFGDGVTLVESEPYATHTFQAFGNYTVILNVTDSEGESDIATTVIRVIEPPIADFIFEPMTPRVCTMITFDASISVPRGGRIINYEWNFGDGSPGEFGVVVTHRFLHIGDLNVSLNVTDSEGQWNMKTETLEVLPHIADLNEDGIVNIVDVTIFAISFGSFPGHEKWNARADLDENGIVNVLDGVVIARSYNMCIDPFDC